MFFNIRHLPLQQKQFGTEGWTHGSHHAVTTGASGAIEQIVLHHRKHRNGGEISALPKSVPGDCEWESCSFFYAKICIVPVAWR
jgi:hypothetical protein